MTIPGSTHRAANPKALERDRHSRGLNNEVGPLDDVDLERAPEDELRASAAEGDDPGAARDDVLTGDANPVRGNRGPTETETGGIGEEFKDLKAAKDYRHNLASEEMDLGQLAKTSKAASNPTGDTVSSGGQTTDVRRLATGLGGAGTDGGTGAAGLGSGVGTIDVLSDAPTGRI